MLYCLFECWDKIFLLICSFQLWFLGFLCGFVNWSLTKCGSGFFCPSSSCKVLIFLNQQFGYDLCTKVKRIMREIVCCQKCFMSGIIQATKILFMKGLMHHEIIKHTYFELVFIQYFTNNSPGLGWELFLQAKQW